MIKNATMNLLKGAAILSAVRASNTSCGAIFHQAKEPDAIRKLRKF